jgi:quercetin dioxygenase-like cupin family protein
MSQSTRRLHRSAVGALAVAVLAGAFGFGAVVAQQQTPATKVTGLMKQVVAEYPGHEVTMITLDIPPGGGSLPHRHPGHHTFGYVLEGTYKIKLDIGPEKTLTRGQNLLRGARPASRGIAQWERYRARQGSGHHARRIRQTDDCGGAAVARWCRHDGLTFVQEGGRTIAPSCTVDLERLTHTHIQHVQLAGRDPANGITKVFASKNAEEI